MSFIQIVAITKEKKVDILIKNPMTAAIVMFVGLILRTPNDGQVLIQRDANVNKNTKDWALSLHRISFAKLNVINFPRK